MKELVYGMDINCYRLRAAHVNLDNGKLEGDILEIYFNNKNYEEVLNSISNIIPRGSKIGISIPGVIDKNKLEVKLSINSRLGENVTLPRDLQEGGYLVKMSNDVVSEAHAENAFGIGNKDFALATYSTGFNAVPVLKGNVHFKPEFGHQSYDNFSKFICGCGIKGCLEVFVSGSGAGKMAQDYFNKNNTNNIIIKYGLDDFNKREGTSHDYNDLADYEIRSKIIDSVEGRHIYMAYDKNPHDDPQRFIRNLQLKAITESLNRIAVVYNPLDSIVLKGGLTDESDESKSWKNLFKPAIKAFHDMRLRDYSCNPDIYRTKIKEIGIVGGAVNWKKFIQS